MRLLVVVAAVVCSLAAQTGQTILEGVVLNARTGEPLRKAQVVLMLMGDRPSEPVAVPTDAEGKFRVAGIEPGRYRVMPQRNGFVNRQRDASTVLTIAKGQHLKDLTFKLEPAAVIAGRVSDEDGEPLANVRVQAMRYRYFRGRRELMPSGFASTDDLGSFRMFGLQAGRYYIKAVYTDNRMMFGTIAGARAGDDSSYAPVYYPGVTDPAHAVALTVGAGEEKLGVDFRLTPSRTVRVRGRVTPPPPAERTMGVMLMQRGTPMSDRPAFGRIQRDGSFEIRGVSPGAYVATVMGEREGVRLSARRDIDVANSDVEGVVLTLAPGIDIAGSVRVENESEPKPDLSTLRIWLEPDTPGPGGADGGTVKANGEFTLKNAGTGDYRLRVMPMPERYYVSRARFGDTDVLAGTLRVGDGAAGPIEIVLSGDAGTLEGLVTDGDAKPVPGAAVALLGGPVAGDSAPWATADQSGRYVLRSVRPGEYTVYAFAGAEPGAWDDPDFIQAYKDERKTVTVDRNGRQTVDLRAIAIKEQ